MRPETGVKIGAAMMAIALAGMIIAGFLTYEPPRRYRPQIGYALHLYSGDFSEEFPSYGALPGPGPELVLVPGDGGAEGRVLTEGAP